MNEKVFEIREIGKVNLEFFEKGFGKLKTDDIIVTGERLQHIKTRHPNDYDLFEKYGKISVTEPDYVIKDCKNAGTVFMVKKMMNTNLNVVVRVALNSDKENIKNSILTFYRLRDRNLNKLIEKNEILYKKT